MRDLTVGIIQDDITWQDPAANRARHEAHLETMPDVDLLVLPEMFSTGFYMQPSQCYETMDGQTVAWMAQTAEAHGCVVTGSLIMGLGERYVNRMIWARPDGSIDWYDKRHLFRYGGEHHHFSAGDRKTVFELNGWRVSLFVCYDLRFPVWSRNTGDYDVALFVANWPQARQYAWDTLVRARAIENQAYVLGVNRLGSNPESGDTYAGGSVILDFLGQPLFDAADQVCAATVTLSAADLAAFLDHFPAGMDRDRFSIQNVASD